MGYTMGTICALNYANVFMGTFERTYIYPYMTIWKLLRSIYQRLFLIVDKLVPALKIPAGILKIAWLSVTIFENNFKFLQYLHNFSITIMDYAENLSSWWKPLAYSMFYGHQLCLQDVQWPIPAMCCSCATIEGQ